VEPYALPCGGWQIALVVVIVGGRCRVPRRLKKKKMNESTDSRQFAERNGLACLVERR
jgi:hypothetical protein